MYTYQLGNILYDELSRGVDLSDEETVDYAFDLNEFFATNESGKFVLEDEVKKFLRSLFTNEKYPFSTPELRRELSHTMWYLNRVASAKALKKMMDSEEFSELFGEYEVVIAAGDGRTSDEDKINAKALELRCLRRSIMEVPCGNPLEKSRSFIRLVQNPVKMKYFGGVLQHRSYISGLSYD